MALIINMDSTLETASVSIAKDGLILKEKSNVVQKEHAAFLHVAVKELLQQLNILITDVDAIATTIGPGSYTGLRVCLAAAKGLAYALQKPLITIGTLEAMAKAMILEEQNTTKYLYCPMIDARRMEVYTAVYDHELNEIIPPHAEIINDTFPVVSTDEKEIIFFGSGMEKFRQIAVSKNHVFKTMPSISDAINLLSYDKFNGELFADVAASTPLYTKEFYNL